MTISLEISEDILLQVREKLLCSICRGDRLEEVVDLPNLPLTGIYVTEPDPNYRGIDQGFNVCADCGHGQLRNAVDPDSVYDHTYTHRGGVSPIATGGNDFFADFLDNLTPGHTFDRILDVGCSDLYLSRKIAHKGRESYGIDPVWKMDTPPSGEKINVIGALVEDVDFDKELSGRPDLVVSAHTFEHIDEPRAQLERLVEFAEDDALFIVEVPGFDTMLRIYRFDQVFHQHINHFSVASMRRLIEELGCRYVTHTYNYNFWGGTMLTAFRKGVGSSGDSGDPAPERPTANLAKERLKIFRDQLENLTTYLERAKPGTIYGYGAAQMLPVLAYHMNSDLSFMDSVLDDMPGRSNLTWPDLNVRIKQPTPDLDLTEATVVITALDSVRPIMRRCLGLSPRQIAVPLQSF